MSIANEILMHFRSQKKSSGDLSLSDSIDTDGDGNSMSLMDIIAQDDDMLERVSMMETCMNLNRSIDTALTDREAEIIRLRYGIGGAEAKTQREVAVSQGISRSYVSRIEKKALEKLRSTFSE